MRCEVKVILLVLAAMSLFLLAGCEWVGIKSWECKGSLLGTWDVTLYLSQRKEARLHIAAEIPTKGGAVRLGGYIHFDREAYPLNEESRRAGKPDGSWQARISFLHPASSEDELGPWWVLVATYTACEPTFLRGIVFQQECVTCTNYEEIGSWRAWKEVR